MPNRDNYTRIKLASTKMPVLINSSTNGAYVDTRMMDAATMIAFVGASTGTPTTANKLTITIQESSSTAASGFAAVAAADLLGEISGTTIGAFAVLDGAADLSKIYSVGYIGSKRYIRVKYTETGTFPGALIGVGVVGEDLNFAPQA
jgi:hypothetical protein